MTSAEKSVESPRRGVLMFITPCAMLSAVIMFLFFDQRGWETREVAFEGVLILICACLVLTTINAQKFWWAPRIVAFIIFALYLSYLSYELLTQPFFVPTSKGAANPLNAVLGFCIFGIPCLLYALSGSTLGPIANVAKGSSPTRSAILLARFVITMQYVLLGYSVVMLVVLVARGCWR